MKINTIQVRVTVLMEINTKQVTQKLKGQRVRVLMEIDTIQVRVRVLMEINTIQVIQKFNPCSVSHDGNMPAQVISDYRDALSFPVLATVS